MVSKWSGCGRMRPPSVLSSAPSRMSVWNSCPMTTCGYAPRHHPTGDRDRLSAAAAADLDFEAGHSIGVSRRRYHISAAAAKAPLLARPVLPGLCRPADGGRYAARQDWGDAILRDRAPSHTEAMGHRAVRRGLAAFHTVFRRHGSFSDARLSTNRTECPNRPAKF